MVHTLDLYTMSHGNSEVHIIKHLSSIWHLDCKAHDHIKITPQEREIEPHSYGTAPQPRGRTTPSSSGETKMAMKMVVESMEMAPGAIPHSGRLPEQRILSPESCFGDDGGYGTFRGFSLGSLGFSRNEEYMGEEAESGRPGGPRRHQGAGQGLAMLGWALATWQPTSGLLVA